LQYDQMFVVSSKRWMYFETIWDSHWVE